jgi:bifunctional non-homologous end joining protein LigD
MGVLELHPWGSRNDDLEHPDRIVIDLDPDEAISWKTLAESARQTRALLKELGLESFLKNTGGKGLHIVAPIVAEHDWPTLKQFAHAVALSLEKISPQLYLTKMSKAARKGRIFVDYLRNERGATAVSPFSPRARSGVTVSVPLSWSELDLPDRQVFHVSDFANWKGRLKRDPWKSLPGLKQRIDLEKSARFLR